MIQWYRSYFATTVQIICSDGIAAAYPPLILPGGVHHSISDTAVAEEVRSAPTTNVSPEPNFAGLDRVLPEKPNATHIALEPLLLNSHNCTSEWLRSKSVDEREKLFKAASELSSVKKRQVLKAAGRDN